MKNEKYFAVIDTETNWNDKVMSIGVVIADTVTFEPIDRKYYILAPECDTGGIYSSVMLVKGVRVDLLGPRKDVLHHFKAALAAYNVTSLFAYNAAFDCKHLYELKKYKWFDIMKLAAYRQYNRSIPSDADCCKTGRLKRDYGVEPIMRMLTGNLGYCEVHNALCDAVDELKIMKLLEHPIEAYACAQINCSTVIWDLEL